MTSSTRLQNIVNELTTHHTSSAAEFKKSDWKGLGELLSQAFLRDQALSEGIFSDDRAYLKIGPPLLFEVLKYLKKRLKSKLERA